ncbi:MAG: heme lyase CcmF/NrfE family subunit [Deltaproteobacteria bacterium]|jgi:cytochrome c-type biogenesis protein CcmF|nr:heme lyase CcmF/NrfE family subunit [Deltaproteobacteria bacterium]MBT4526989.1 heme lyase CcmF/NrfE family subunit [Deltaproteobacteria bacterium]
MFINIGYFALLTSLGLMFYASLALTLGIKYDKNELILSAKLSFIAKFILIAVAFASLTYAFIVDDFSIQFVSLHSSSDLPLFYKITAVWGGMEGSLLLWELILSFFIVCIIINYHKINRDILPYSLIILSLISLFLLFLLVGWSNPLERVFPVPPEGRGLNPLLQNPGMIYHPPSLYLGYVGFSIPFAFAIGSLLRGKLDNQWILSTRRWTLFSWFFLTVGMMLGGEWAYLELGWGGYWAWDPVENASLMPWLTGTAFLHSVIVQEKRNTLKIWNMLLIITTFSLTILGTFITRSGVLNSVHSFAKSNIGPAFLVFIVITLIFTLIVLKTRLPLLQSQAKSSDLMNKENAFLINNIVFTGMCFTVLYGTVFPLLAEGLADKKISIQAPFFNTIMLPMGLITVFLMGISHLLGWRKTSKNMLFHNSKIPLGVAIGLTVLVGILLSVTWEVVLLSWVIVFSGWVILSELLKSYLPLKRKPAELKLSIPKEIISAFLKNNRKKGGLIIHLAIIIFAIGVSGNFYSQETSFTLNLDERKQFGDYAIQFEEVKVSREHNTERYGAVLKIFKQNQQITTLVPVKAYYPTSPQPMTEVAIHRTIPEDLYISLSSINNNGSVTLSLFINPLINFIWISVVVIFIGVIFSFIYTPIQIKNKKEKFI